MFGQLRDKEQIGQDLNSDYTSNFKFNRNHDVPLAPHFSTTKHYTTKHYTTKSILLRESRKNIACIHRHTCKI